MLFTTYMYNTVYRQTFVLLVWCHVRRVNIWCTLLFQVCNGSCPLTYRPSVLHKSEAGWCIGFQIQTAHMDCIKSSFWCLSLSTAWLWYDLWCARQHGHVCRPTEHSNPTVIVLYRFVLLKSELENGFEKPRFFRFF